MKKYSRVRKYGKKAFRYNYDDHVLEYICKPNAEMLEEIRREAEECKIDWMRIEAVQNLESYEATGYITITSEGLSIDSWKENPKSWMGVYSDELDEEMHFLQKEFEMFG